MHVVPALWAALALFIIGGLGGCGGGNDSAFGGPTHNRYDRSKVEESLKKVEESGLVIGEFNLKRNGVVDGDTVKVEGLDTSLRLLAIDTEEKFFHKEDRRQYEMGWEQYAAQKRGDSVKPAKYATPLGEEARDWAKQWFEGVTVVRLERDHPKDMRGAYGRYLSYVFADKDGEWVNYNVECVRAGMSPYFTKYGYSRRFHDQFVAAQNEAREAKRGIWDPTKQHYPDYDERLVWWNIRADFIAKFEAEAEDRDEFIVLGQWDAIQRLEDSIGKPVEILATIGDIRLSQKGPNKVLLSRRRNSNFPLIYFDKDVFGSSRVSRWKGEFVRARGTVNKYYNKYRKKHELQIIVDLPGQVTGPILPWFEEYEE
jgi:endonuclease YncB( thermonuclease family)